MGDATSKNANSRCARYLVVCSLCAPTLIFLAFLHYRHGVPLRACFALGPAMYAFFFVPGFVVTRYIFRLSPRTPWEGFLACLLVGTFIAPPLWYVSCTWRVDGLALAVCIGAAVLIPLRWAWDLRARRRPFRLSLPSLREVAVVWVVLAVSLIWSYELDPVELRGDEARVVTPWGDHCLHAAMTGELARGVPPTAVPFVTGVTSMGYHLMPNVWVEMLRQACGTGPYETYFYIAQPLRYVLLSLAVYLALVGRFGAGPAALGVASMLGFALYPEKYAYVNGMQLYLSSNFPSAFGIAGMFLVFHLATSDRPRERNRALLLACIVAALLLWFKANHALIVAPAVSLYAVWACWKTRSFRWLSLCLGAGAILLAIRYVELSGAELKTALTWAPLAFVEYWWTGNGLPVFLDAALRPFVDALPALLRIPAIIVSCVIHSFFVGAIVLLYVGLVMKFGRTRGRSRRFDALTCIFLVTALGGFIFLPVTDPWVWNLSMHNFALVNALLMAMMGPAVWDLVSRLRRRGAVTSAVVYVVLAGVLLFGADALRYKAFWGKRTVCATMDVDLYECLRFVRNETPADALILQPAYMRESGFAPAASMITQRRQLLDCSAAVARQLDLSSTIEDARSFYASHSATAVEHLAAKYGVDYIVADAAAVIEGSAGRVLTPVFDRGSYAVFQVTQRAVHEVDTAHASRAASRPSPPSATPRQAGRF